MSYADLLFVFSMVAFFVIFLGGYFYLRARDALTKTRVILLFVVGALVLTVPILTQASLDWWFWAGMGLFLFWMAVMVAIMSRARSVR